MTGSIRARLAELERAAASRLPREIHDYYAGGAGDETALDEAEAAWARYRLRPRVLHDVSAVGTGVELLGNRLPHPVLVAPTAWHAPLHEDGEVATARGAAEAASVMVVSTRASRPIEEIAAAAGRWWFQVYVLRDRRRTESLVRRAADAGAAALVLTADTPYVGRKARQGRVFGLAGDDVEQDPSITPDVIGRLAELSRLPVLVKGVLRGDDARRCLDAGAAGLIVSNHGGRQVGRAVSTAAALPEVVAAAGAAPVLVDGGLRSGEDVAIALALGARAVLLGRPVLWALADGGAGGVRELIADVVADLSHTLALLGVASITELDADFVR